MKSRPLILTLLLLMLVPGRVAATDSAGVVHNALERQLSVLDTSELDRFLETVGEELRTELPEFSLREILATADGGIKFDLGHIMSRFWAYLVREIVFNSSLLGQLVVLAVFCAIMKSLTKAFAIQGAADVAFLVVFLSLLYLSLQSFRAVMELAVQTIDTMVSFMQAMLPLMITMLAAVGSVTTATIFHPLLFTVVQAVATIVKNVLLPLAFLSALLGVLGVISKDFPMKKLSDLARQWMLTILGLLFIVFFGVLSVRGAIAPVSDGLALKTAKFLTGTFVPVIGGRMAEALDVVVGGSMLIKNALGVFGMVTVFLLTAFPILKAFSVLVIYRIATALIEPISDERLVMALSTLANSLTLVLACMLTTGVMFFICITVLIGLGNVAAFMR